MSLLLSRIGNLSYIQIDRSRAAKDWRVITDGFTEANQHPDSFTAHFMCDNWQTMLGQKCIAGMLSHRSNVKRLNWFKFKRNERRIIEGLSL